MNREEVIEIIKKRFGTSDEDLNDLDTIMTALDGLDKVEYLQQQIANDKVEYERKMKELDDAWRTRYRDRFFSGDSAIDEVVEKMERAEEKESDAAEITIDEYLDRLDEKGEFK